MLTPLYVVPSHLDNLFGDLGKKLLFEALLWKQSCWCIFCEAADKECGMRVCEIGFIPLHSGMIIS